MNQKESIESCRTKYCYCASKTTGEIWAVEVVDGSPTRCSGPLHCEEVWSNTPYDYSYDDDASDFDLDDFITSEWC